MNFIKSNTGHPHLANLANLASLAIIALFVIASALTLSCSSRSKLFATWREPDAPPGPYRRVVAIALASNEITRRIAEDEFARRLPKGTMGFKSYEIVPKEDEGDVDKVVAKLRAEGIDGVAVMRLIEEKNSVAYDPGSFSRPFNTFHNYYGGVWASYHDPGYLTTEIAVRVETAFYSVADEKLVWTGYSQTMNPNSSRVVIDDVARLVVQELKRERIIQ